MNDKKREKSNRTDLKEEGLKHLRKVSSENRGSSVYFFVTAIVALVISQLIIFVFQLNPNPTQPGYYTIKFRLEFLPQGIGLLGSVFLVFESYRRIGTLLIDTQIGKALTSFLCFLILLATYVYAFSKPNYWVVVIGFNLLMVSVKCFYSLIYLKTVLKKAGINKDNSSTEVISRLKRGIIRHLLFASSLLLIGYFVYPHILNALSSPPINTLNGFPLTPLIVNSVMLIALFLLAGSSYYYSPAYQVKAGFSKEKMNEFKENLANTYRLLSDFGIKLYDS